jgi:hypothetical protein
MTELEKARAELHAIIDTYFDKLANEDPAYFVGMDAGAFVEQAMEWAFA